MIPDYDSLLIFLHRINALKGVPRFKSSLASGGDTVAEHSWRLVLMVYVIGTTFEIDFDLNKALGIALAHDIAELKTGDIDGYEVIKRSCDT